MAYALIFDGSDDYVAYSTPYGHADAYADRNDTSQDWELEFDLEFSGSSSLLHGLGEGGNECIRLRRSDGLFRFYAHAAGGAFLTLGSGVLLQDTRQTIRVVKASGAATIDVYVDGVLEASGANITTNTIAFDEFGRNRFNDKFNGKLYGITFTDNVDSSNDFFADPSASSGTGSTLPDSTGSNDGTLTNFPTDDSQWEFYDDGGGGTTVSAAPIQSLNHQYAVIAATKLNGVLQ